MRLDINNVSGKSHLYKKCRYDYISTFVIVDDKDKRVSPRYIFIAVMNF